jgi:hypothetical protein
MSALLEIAGPWVGLVLIAGAGVAAMSTLGARSLVGMGLALSAMAAMGAAALGVYGGDGVIALAAFGVGLAPLLLMSGLLLSTRVAKTRAGGTMLMLIAAAGGAVMVAIAAPELARAPATPSDGEPIGLWIAALVFVTAITCAGLLGYGERGVLGRRPSELDQ